MIPFHKHTKMADILNIKLKRDDLHTKLGGGIPTSSILLVEGGDGAGKSIIAQRFTYGLLKNNHSVSYISSELSLMEFVSQMKSLDYNVRDRILSKQLLFISVFPYLGNANFSERFMDRLLVTKPIFENEVILFDTLSFLIIQDDLSIAHVFDFIKIIKKITNLGKTLIFCVDPSHLNDRVLSIIRGIADGYLSLEIKSVLGSIMRVATIKRYKRPLSSVTPQISFKVEPGIGISIELASLS